MYAKSCSWRTCAASGGLSDRELLQYIIGSRRFASSQVNGTQKSQPEARKCYAVKAGTRRIYHLNGSLGDFSSVTLEAGQAAT